MVTMAAMVFSFPENSTSWGRQECQAPPWLAQPWAELRGHPGLGEWSPHTLEGWRLLWLGNQLE